MLVAGDVGLALDLAEVVDAVVDGIQVGLGPLRLRRTAHGAAGFEDGALRERRCGRDVVRALEHLGLELGVVPRRDLGHGLLDGAAGRH